MCQPEKGGTHTQLFPQSHAMVKKKKKNWFMHQQRKKSTEWNIDAEKEGERERERDERGGTLHNNVNHPSIQCAVNGKSVIWCILSFQTERED